MKNINQLLGSAYRSDLFGFQMASRGLAGFSPDQRRPERRAEGAKPQAFWDAPQPGMQGILCLAHHVDVTDALTMELRVDGKPTALRPMRNRWTPAWMDTVYRSEIDPEVYPNSGTLTVRDRKAILRNDVFVSHLTLTNERREAVVAELSFAMPFEKRRDGVYRVDVRTLPRALGKALEVKGSAVLLTDAGGSRVKLTIAPMGTARLRVAMAFSPEGEEAAYTGARQALQTPDPFAENEQTFNRWFQEQVPVLECENADFRKVYYYRWFMVYRGIHEPSRWIDGHPIDGECIYESPYGGWFGTVVGLPIAMQVADAGWMRSPSAVKNQLSHWSRGTHGFQDYIQFTPLAAWRFYQLHRDRAWLASVYEGFADFVKRKLQAGLPPLTVGSWLTGAEYQPNFYQYTPTPWDYRHDNEGAKVGFAKKAVHRVDEVCFLILSLRGCMRMARELGVDEDQALFADAERELTDFLIHTMWDEEKGFFFAHDPEVDRRCDQAACYDGFVPFIDGVAGEAYFRAFDRLWDEQGFFSEYGALSVARDCPMFWYDNCIAGPTASSVRKPHEYACSWNGTVWPFANSLVAMGLGDAARQRVELQAGWLRFFEGFTELHFAYGDRSTPVVCEHYRTGDGACFSQFPEYFHSSWIDLFMRYYAGIWAQDGEVNFEPFTQEAFSLRGVRIGAHSYDFVQTADGQRKVRKITETEN